MGGSSYYRHYGSGRRTLPGLPSDWLDQAARGVRDEMDERGLSHPETYRWWTDWFAYLVFFMMLCAVVGVGGLLLLVVLTILGKV